MDETVLELEEIRMDFQKRLSIASNLTWFCMFTFASLSVLYVSMITQTTPAKISGVLALTLVMLVIIIILVVLISSTERIDREAKARIEALKQK